MRPFDMWMEQPNAELSATISDDYRYLKEGLGADVFGRKRNPFSVKMHMIGTQPIQTNGDSAVFR